LALFVFVVFKFKRLSKKPLFGVLLIFTLVPLVGYTFFQGNYGVLFDYYLMGYYLPFILLFSIVLSEFSENKYLRYLIGVFLLLFIVKNGTVTKAYITTGLDGPASTLLGNQKEVINWIYKDSQSTEFNVDVYVPPVIPYAYDYLFLWQGTARCGPSLCGQVTDKNVNLLYTVYETDFAHPERLDAWLQRQAGIAKVDYEFVSGGITVQKRTRI